MTADSRFDAQIRAAMLTAPEPDQVDTREALDVVLARSGRGPRPRAGRVAVLAAAAAAVVAVVAVPVVVLDGASESPPVVQPTTRPDADALIGTWLREVAPPSDLAGEWRMDLRADGVLALDPPAAYEGATDGTSYTAADGVFRVDAFVNSLCPEMPPGLYQWSVSGATLRLTAADDMCDTRLELFTGTWTRP